MKKNSAAPVDATVNRWRAVGHHLAALSNAVTTVCEEQGTNTEQCRGKWRRDGKGLLQAASFAAARIRQNLLSLYRALNNAGFSVAQIRVRT